MATTMTTTRGHLVERYWPLLSLMALVGIPAAVSVALVFSLQILRLVDGAYQLLPLIAEVAAWSQWLSFFSCSLPGPALGSAGRLQGGAGFLAMARWHPAVKCALPVLAVLPGTLYIHGSHWLVITFRMLGWRALRSGDVRTHSTD